MRPLIAIVPSYARPVSLANTLELIKRCVEPDDLLVLDQPKGCALGSGLARRRLVSEVVAKHGENIAILSLDDDLESPLDGDAIRAAARHLDEESGLGIVKLPNRSTPSGARLRFQVPVTHAFILAGEMIASGINYDAEEYADEVCLSLAAYFAGWRVGTSGRAGIRHRISSRGRKTREGGGIEEAYSDGIRVVCRKFPEWRSRGWITYLVGHRAGVELPTPFTSVRVTRLGREVHRAAVNARG